MEIKKEVIATLNVPELEILIKEFLLKKGIKVTSINFSVSGHESEGDWQAALPLHYKLDEVVCKGEEVWK